MRFDFDRNFDNCVKIHGEILAKEYDLYYQLIETNNFSVKCEAALASRDCHDYYFMDSVYDEAKLAEMKMRYDQRSSQIISDIENFGDTRLIMFNSLCEDLEKHKLENAKLRAEIAKQQDTFVAQILPIRPEPERPKMPLNFSAAAAAAEDSEERAVKTPILARIRTVLGNKRRK